MSSKSSGANEKLTPIDGRWKFHFRFGVRPFVHSFHRPKNKKKTDLSEHYVKVYFVFIFGQPRPVVAAVFLFFSSGGASKVLA